MADTSSDQKKTIGYFVRKIRKGDDVHWEKDELLDVIYWWRQVAGILFGLLWGVSATTGFLGVLMFVVLNCMLTVAMYKSILGIDEDEYGGHGELLTEGLPGCIFSFLLSWVLSYTAFHAPV